MQDFGDRFFGGEKTFPFARLGFVQMCVFDLFYF